MKPNLQKQNSMMQVPNNYNEQGSALVTLLFFAVLISLVAGNVGNMVRQQMHISKRVVDRTSAQQVAEGAANQALAYVAENPEEHLGPLPSNLKNGSIGDGEYQVELDESNDSYFSIISTGTINEMSRTVRIHGRVPIEGQAFAYALFSNGDIDCAGTGDVTGDSGDGDIHANQDVIISGNAYIAGSASAVGSVDGAGNVGGTVTEGENPISFPNVDYDHYYQIAEDNNEIHDGDLYLDSDRTPTGGILWVNGDVHVGGGGRKSPATFTGMLIATGDIKQASHYRHYQNDDRPSMISRDGNVHLSGQTQILDGLVYAGSGRVKLSGGSAFHGAIMAWDEIDIKGNWDLIEYVQQDPEIEKGDDRIQILAWEM
ncbi:MAG: hypothetical protein ACOCUY_00280 [Verrucomicrobiota bacterium]